MSTANTIAFVATAISAGAFAVAFVAMLFEQRFWPATLYIGLTLANTAIAFMATS